MEFIEKIAETEESFNSIDKICIILTSTVNVNPIKKFIFDRDPASRIELYLKSIRKWLEQTHFKIVLVENSGYKFPELDEYVEKYKDRFELILFNEADINFDDFNSIGAHALATDKDYLYTSKGTSEMFAIYYTKQCSQLIQKSEFIIKITCRYFIPQFEDFFKNKNIDDYLAIRQNNCLHCEIVGAHKSRLDDLFIPAHFRGTDGLCHHHLEELYEDRILTRFPQDKVLVCDVFEIEPTRQGGTLDLKTFL